VASDCLRKLISSSSSSWGTCQLGGWQRGRSVGWLGRRHGNGCQCHRRQQTNTAATATSTAAIKSSGGRASAVMRHERSAPTTSARTSFHGRLKTEPATRCLTTRVPTWRTEIPTTSTHTSRCTYSYVSLDLHAVFRVFQRSFRTITMATRTGVFAKLFTLA